MLLYLSSRALSEFFYQVTTVAVGWQIYQLTDSAFYPGLSGLIQFIASALMVFAAGHVADRYDRRRAIALGAGTGRALADKIFPGVLVALQNDFKPDLERFQTVI